MTKPDVKVQGLVISTEPLVTLSFRRPGAPLGLVSVQPEHFIARRSLNLVALTWAANPHDINEMTAERTTLEGACPKADFCLLANDSSDLLLLTKAGFPAIVANGNIFIDDDTFRPLPSGTAIEPVADAIYVARFQPYKQHALCAALGSVAFIYGPRNEWGPDTEAEVRQQSPGARYLNHEAGGGIYRRLSRDEVASYLSRARVGLCLSSVEGHMRAAIEYLMCGLPVVTVPSEGGRDRYMLSDFTITCEANPESVARAVRDLMARNLSRHAIRRQVDTILAFERHIFLHDLNMLTERTHGVRGHFKDLAALIKGDGTNRFSREIVEPLS